MSYRLTATCSTPVELRGDRWEMWEERRPLSFPSVETAEEVGEWRLAGDPTAERYRIAEVETGRLYRASRVLEAIRDER